MIDEVEIYNRALSAPEIQSIFDAGSAGKCKNFITTVAGTGLFGFSGDGGAATSARLNTAGINDVAFDAAGNLFIADVFNNRVRRVDAGADGLVAGALDEIISTVAGTGVFGFSGDGGPATSAGLPQPAGLAFDAAGNLYITDLINRLIRRVDAGADGLITGAPDEIITTVLQNTLLLQTPVKLAFDAAGNLFIANISIFRVLRVDAGADGLVTGAPDEILTTVVGSGVIGGALGDGGPATSASMTPPSDLAFDTAGNLYIAESRTVDPGNNRVRRVDAGADGLVTGALDEIITTVAGTGAFGSSGDGGPATSAQLAHPVGLAFDAAGNLYIADHIDRLIRRVDAGADGQITGALDEIITTVAGVPFGGVFRDGVPATISGLSRPHALAFDAAGNLCIAGFSDRVRCVERLAPPVVTNQAPVASAGGPYQGNEGASIALDASGSTDPDGSITSFEWDLDNDGQFDDATGATTSVVSPDNRVFTVAVRVTDDDELTDTDSALVTVLNVAPSASVSGPTPVDEGDTKSYAATVTDPGVLDTHTVVWDCDDDSLFDDGTGPNVSCTFPDGLNTVVVSAKATDNDGDSGTGSLSVTVNNVAPTIDTITLPLDPVNINDQSSFDIDVDFSDPAGVNDEDYSCDFDLENDGSNDVAVSGVTGGSCSTPLNYVRPGVYTVKVTVTDKDGGSDMATATEFIVIYDSSAGFVTGGGWIDSPADACTLTAACEGTTGKANFGFVSKYKKGATTPTGQTEFQFRAGDLNFHSTEYEWLVVAGARAQYKGSGTIKGVEGDFGFILTAIDGQIPGGGGVDRFRIKIIDKDIDTVVYDNQRGDLDHSDLTTELGGGQIVIHKGK